MKRRHRARRQLVLSVPTRLVDVRRLSWRQEAVLARVRAGGERGVLPDAVAVLWRDDEEAGVAVPTNYVRPRAALKRLEARGLVREVHGGRFVANVVGERRSVHVR